MGDTQLPLSGVILCCTSIPPEKRSDLAAIASQMGAVHKLDLTSDVTHLVVGDTDTPKYKFVAKERPDVKCVLPSWIEALRVSWLEGGDTDVEGLEKEHRLPTFTGLKLCVTGFDDPIYRKELEDSIIDNGGEYRGNLTKDITHLVAKVPAGAKYNYAGQWGIRTVAVEWLEQSIERGMILDETLYHLSIPPESRGKNAWIRRSTSATSLGKRTRADEIGPQHARKLRRTASARLSSQNVGLWTELVGGPILDEESKTGAWDELPQQMLNNGMGPSEANLGTLKIAPTTNNTQQTFKRSFSEANLGSLLPKPLQREGIFHGKMFLLEGFNEKKTAVLQEHLRSHGAKIVDDIAELSLTLERVNVDNCYLLVPHTTCASDTLPISKGEPRPAVVTDLWVERCLYRKALEDPRAHVMNTPFPNLPIAGFEDLSICSTGFQGIELSHTSKAVKLMGGTYCEYFTPTSSVLVCNAIIPGHEKLRHAQLWSVPAVKTSWLWDSIRRGELMPFGLYLVQALTDPSLFSKDPKRTGISSKAKQQDDKQPSADSTRRPVKKAFSPEGPRQQRIQDTLHPAREKEITMNTAPKPPTSLSQVKSSHRSETQPSAIYLDDDLSLHVELSVDNDSSNTLNATSTPAPLQETTPNSSPPKPAHSPTKVPSPSKRKDTSSPKPVSQGSSLGPAISSLLAHHQRSNTNPPSSKTSDQPRPYRRRRQLLGRAPSNLSSHSYANGIEISRASSVDTINTDGLGTPLEPSNSNRNANKAQTSSRPRGNLDPMLYSASNEEDPDRFEEPLQMTQLGYEDPNVAAWRERVAVKMSGGKVKEGKTTTTTTTTPGRKSGGAKEEGGKGSLGISKRTRLASGR